MGRRDPNLMILNRRSDGIQRIWTALRVNREADVAMIAMQAQVSEVYAAEYLRRLYRSGYCDRVLTRRAPKKPLKNPSTEYATVYKLRRNNGPQAPRYTVLGFSATKVMRDPNNGINYQMLKASTRALRVPVYVAEETSHATPVDKQEVA